MSQTSKRVYHSVLNDLGLAFTTDNKKKSVISPLQVLDYLLKENVISQDSLRTAVQALSPPTSTPQSESVLTTSNDATQAKHPLPSQHRTRHIALRFFYDGAEFSGLAQNVGQDSDNSVERALFQALIKAKLVESRECSGYSRCGRTDRGVSAAGQVVAMQLKSAIPLDASMDPNGAQLLETSQLPKNEQDRISAWVIPRKRTKQHLGESGNGDGDRVAKELREYPYAKILNNLLPPEIRVLGWAPVSDEFSARFSASTRTYRYFFVRRILNLERMQQGLDLMVGKHDFRNFCKMDVEKVYNFERVIHAAELVDPMVERNSGASDRICFVQIHGQAFLWHQIRCIMEILFMIGNGLEEPSVITELFDIEKNPGKPNYPLAPEKPLVLKDCGYPNLQFGYSVQNIWSVMCQLEQQWEELALAAARIRDGIDGLRDVSVLKDDLLEFATAKVLERRRKLEKSSIDVSCEVDESGLSGSLPQSSTFVSWEHALLWLSNACNLIPDSNGLNTSIHIPLLRRSRGTTYDQKITALKKSDKRRIKYEEGVVKKRKTAEEDASFYSHMTKQGGTGI